MHRRIGTRYRIMDGTRYTVAIGGIGMWRMQSRILRAIAIGR